MHKTPSLNKKNKYACMYNKYAQNCAFTNGTPKKISQKNQGYSNQSEHQSKSVYQPIIVIDILWLDI